MCLCVLCVLGRGLVLSAAEIQGPMKQGSQLLIQCLEMTYCPILMMQNEFLNLVCQAHTR